jgi:mycothiol synthase
MTVDRVIDTTLRLEGPPIDGVRFRHPTGSDADYAAMAAMISEANRHDGVPWLPTAANLREESESSDGHDPIRDVVLAEIDGEVVAEGAVDRVMRAGRASYDVNGHVLPAVRRRGIGRSLLRAGLRRAAERAAVEDPPGSSERPAHIRGFAEETEVGHRAILEAEGFEPIRWIFRMRRATLADIPEAPLPDGLEFRPVRAEDHRAIVEAEYEAFRDHWEARDFSEASFEALFRMSDIDTSLWVVAWDGDQVAGVVENWIWRDENERLGVARGWLDHISVRRPWRRRGVGRAITAQALRRLAGAGMAEAMLGVDAENPTGALGLYEGLGFEVDQRATIYGRAIDG